MYVENKFAYTDNIINYSMLIYKLISLLDYFRISYVFYEVKKEERVGGSEWVRECLKEASIRTEFVKVISLKG